MANKQHRKRVYVDRPVQGGLVVRLIFSWLAFSALGITVWLTLNYFADPTPGIAFYLQSVASNCTPLFMAFAATLPIFILHIIRFTHRFAGPVLRLRRELSDLADGKQPSTLTFRDGDYWKDLAVEFNRVAEVIAEQKQEIARLKRDNETPSIEQESEAEPVAIG